MFKSGLCTSCTSCGSCQQNPNVDTPTLFCMHCTPSEASCLKSCINNAMIILGGAITINQDKCTQCRKCVEVCPIDVINI